MLILDARGPTNAAASVRVAARSLVTVYAMIAIVFDFLSLANHSLTHHSIGPSLLAVG